MAIVRGRKLYESEKLKAVAASDGRAVSEYSWMLPGISDDWGRFKASPRWILGVAYENRPDVNELMIADWLALYEKHGLLRLYTEGATIYAEWTNYMGDPVSQRRFHLCPEPPWSDHSHSAKCRVAGGAVTTESKAEIDALRKAPKDTRSATASESSLGTCLGGCLGECLGTCLGSVPAVPSVPSVPSVPTVTDQRTVERTTAIAPAKAPPWNSAAIGHWQLHQGAVNKAHAARITNALRPLVERHTWPMVEPHWIDALEESSGWGDPARFTPEVFARSFEARRKKRDGPPRGPTVNPKAQARQDQANAMILGGLRRDRESVDRRVEVVGCLPAGSGSDSGDGDATG